MSTTRTPAETGGPTLGDGDTDGTEADRVDEREWRDEEEALWIQVQEF